jgi:hypothetical protein
MTYHRSGLVPGGGVYHLRDPRTDPRPGDMLRCGDAIVCVDQVALSRVVGVVFPHCATSPSGIFDVLISEWTEATHEAALVILPEDDPRHSATILGVP